MLIMVILNPRHVAIVNAVPRNSCGAFRATNAENRGESAMTAIPQNRSNPIRVVELEWSMNGRIRQ